MASSMWLFVVLAFAGNDFAASLSPEKMPVRRQRDPTASRREVDCVFWGDGRPAGHRAGTTRLHAQLFRSSEEAQEYFDDSIRKGKDVVLYYKGCPCDPNDPLSRPSEHKHHYSPRFNKSANLLEDQRLSSWCNVHNNKYEDVSPDKWRLQNFLLFPPVRKDSAPLTISLKQHLEASDEDEGPATAYSDEGNMRCVMTVNASKGHSNMNATLFTSIENATRHFDESVSLGKDLVIQYTGKREWKRHVSPKLSHKLKHVPWLSLLNWCKDIHEQWKEGNKSIVIGSPSKLVLESFLKVSPPLADAPLAAASSADALLADAPQNIEEGFSLAESAETANAWASADFARKTTYDQAQELMSHGMARQVVSYKRFPGWDCGIGNVTDARLAGYDMSVAECKELCDKDLQCGCLQYNRSNGVCFYTHTAYCHEKKCKKSKTTSIYLQTAQWTTDAKKVKKLEGRACAGRGGTVLGVEKKVWSGGACQEVCASEQECTCFNFNRADKTCTTMKGCDLDKCEHSKDDDMYLIEAAYNGYARDHAGQQW